MSQLLVIINLCGSFTHAVWPAVEHLEAYKKAKLPMETRRNLREKLTPQISTPSAVNLIDRLLLVDPSRRLTAEQALAHEFFSEEPPAGDLSCLSQSGNCCLEYLSQRNRQQAANNFRGGHNNLRGLSRGAPNAVPAAGQFRYRAMPPDHQDSNMNFDRIY